MAVNPGNLIMGTGELYTGAFGAIEPTTVTAAPDTAAWTNVGSTTDGVTLTISTDWATIEVDQTIDVPERRLTGREFTIETNLAEPTLENMAVALNGGTPTTASNTKTFEPSYGIAAAVPTYHGLLFDGFAPGGKRRRVTVRKALSTDDVEFAYSKDDVTVLSVTFSAHYVSSSIAPFRIQDDVTTV